VSLRRLAVQLMAVLGLAGCQEPDETDKLLEALAAAAARPAVVAEKPRPTAVNPRLLRRFEPVRSQLESETNAVTPAKVELGRMLYFEKRLSLRQDLSCNSCHDLQRFGADGQVTSPGTRGALGSRNSPTVYNAAGSFAQFWDGRAADVEAQALGPILNPLEMALPSAEQGERVLRSIPGYVSAFKAAFPGESEPVTFANVGRAIGAFERKLTTPGRWDEFLRGKQDALSQRELEGLSIFTNIGCMVCHTGELVGGSMYQKAGVVEPWPNQKDQGRFEVTKQDVDRMMFKVPTLRNVAQTAPYFHDGSAPTLQVAVKMMGKHQLGLDLSAHEVEAIVAWLGALTGELPRDYIREPALPPSSATTPAALP
jgi:cytochrome c peroxidase